MHSWRNGLDKQINTYNDLYIGCDNIAHSVGNPKTLLTVNALTNCVAKNFPAWLLWKEEANILLDTTKSRKLHTYIRLSPRVHFHYNT